MHSCVPSPILVLGEPAKDLRFHLCLHNACVDNHRVLRPDDPAPEERPHAVRFQGEGPQPAAHHTHGASRGGRLHRVLDPHPHLRDHQGPGDHPQLSAADHHLALLHRFGLHQQLPQPSAICLSG